MPTTTPATDTSVQAVDEHGARVQTMFDRIAHGYDRANRWMSFGTDVRWRREAVSRLLPEGATGEPRILDLCAGTLDSTLEIHAQFPTAQILAGDFAQEMLDQGETKLVASARERIETRQMDAHALGIAPASLDALFCAFGVRNVSDLPRATAEQAAALAPGGKLVVLEFFRPTKMVPRVLHAAYNRTILPLVGWAATGDLDAYTYLPRSIGKFESVDAYTELLRESGFTNVSATPLTMGMAWIVEATREEAGGDA